MPLYWTIDSRVRLFTGIADREVSFSDAMGLLEAMAGAGALLYRKLFDGRAAMKEQGGRSIAQNKGEHQDMMRGAVYAGIVDCVRLGGSASQGGRPL